MRSHPIWMPNVTTGMLRKDRASRRPKKLIETHLQGQHQCRRMVKRKSAEDVRF